MYNNVEKDHTSAWERLWRKRRSLGVILSILVVLITVITSGCIFLITNRIYIKSNKESITNHLHLQAAQEAAILSYKLNFAGKTAVNLADIIETMPVYDEETIYNKIYEKLDHDELLFGMGVWFEPYLYNPQEKYYGPYIYRDNLGKNIFTWDYNTPAYDYFSWDWYQAAFGPQKSEIYFSKIFYDPVMDTIFLTGTSPIIKNDQLIGVATADISIREIANYVKGIQVGYEGYGFVLTNNGYIIGNPPFIKNENPASEFSRLEMAVDLDHPGNREYMDLGNTLIKSNGEGLLELSENGEIASYANIGDTGLSLVLIYPQSELYSSFYQTLQYYFILFILLAGSSLFLLRLVVKRLIERPIGHLLGRLQQIMTGDFSNDQSIAGAMGSSNEFHRMGHAVNRMAESLDGLVKDLYQQNAELIESRKKMAISEEKYRHQAYYDPLTTLPNRAFFNEEVNRLIARASDGEKFAVFFMDLDNFKEINDTAGHGTGDQVLVTIAQRLKKMAVERISVSRFGGDEFILLATGITCPADCQRLADRVRQLVSGAICLNEAIYYTNVSIGISIFPDDAATLNDLLRNADTAMFEGKINGKDRSTFFNSRMNEAIMEKSDLEKKLRNSLKNEEFVLYYQPLYSVTEKRIIGFEALIRWLLPGEGMILPGKFIKLVEDTRLIIPLGSWIIQTACRFIRRLLDEGYTDLRISVNVSVVQMMDKDFSQMVLSAIAAAAVPPENLEIEITESKLMESYSDCIQHITRLRQAGVRIAIDDFGTGYSSFSYLRQLPITTIKIDKSFIDDLTPKNTNLAELIIIVGHKMGLELVAEGVETKEQYQMLADYNCDLIQGYLISRPVPEEAALELL